MWTIDNTVRNTVLSMCGLLSAKALFAGRPLTMPEHGLAEFARSDCDAEMSNSVVVEASFVVETETCRCV